MKTNHERALILHGKVKELHKFFMCAVQLGMPLTASQLHLISTLEKTIDADQARVTRFKRKVALRTPRGAK